MPRRGRVAAGALLAGAALVGSVGALVPSASASPADGFPFGSLDQVSATSTGVHVSGWLIDPDGAPASAVHIYVDGAPALAPTADGSRPDVGAAYPSYGPDHGFDVTVDTARGSHQVCVYGIDSGGAGGNIVLGCRTVQVGHSPFGSVDLGFPRPGGVTLLGWTQDPDTTASIGVHVYIDGAFATAATADGDRPDVGTAYGNGSAHGYNVAVDVPVGTHQLCVFGIDATGDANSLIECGLVTLTGTPIGSVDRVELSGGNFRVVGWALDPDTVDPVQLHVYVNEQLTVLDANLPRPDVANAYPGYGPDHGFDGIATIPASGQNGGNLCVYAQNASGTPGETGGGCTTFV
jgi:hypothetical protein